VSERERVCEREREREERGERKREREREKPGKRGMKWLRSVDALKL